MKITEASDEKKVIEIESLSRIAMFLEGMKLGRGGNIRPLGTNDLDQLWNTVKYLQGDKRYTLNK